MAVKSAPPDLATQQLLERGVQLHRAGDLPAAETVYRQVLEKRPRNPDALHLLGLIAEQRGNLDEAATLIDQALEIHEKFPPGHFNRANVARKLGDLPGTAMHLRRGIVLEPMAVTQRVDLSTVLQEQGQFDEAVQCLREALKKQPQYTELYVALARALRYLDASDEILAVTREGLRRDAQASMLHLFASEAQFEKGNLKEGWHGYRWRFDASESAVARRNYALPYWDGGDLSQRRILVWTEQGPGDEVMLANMLPDIATRAKTCAVQCSARLAPLYRRSFPSVTIFDRELTPDELKNVDCQIPIASAGEWLRASFEAFPQHTGYLRADPTLRDQLRNKYLAGQDNTVLVGISWRSTGVNNASDKTVSIAEWGPIFHVPGVTFVNLQYGNCGRDLAAVEKSFGKAVIQDETIDPLKDMDSYAAQVAAMDMVVSSSNTAAHVAGALGVPTHCLLPSSLAHGRRWWWFANRDECQWYPSVQIHRQRKNGPWLEVMRDIGLALIDVATQRGAIRSIAPYLRSMGKAFAELGRMDDAEVLFARLAQEPGCKPEALSQIASLRKRADKIEEAIELYDQAISADPTFAHAYNAKGILLAADARLEEAIETYRTALLHSRESYEIHNNIGNSLRRADKGEEALTHFQESLRLKPGTASVQLNFASTLEEMGRSEEAIDALNALIAANPDYVDAHYNRAQALLSAGRFKEGWAEFSWRLKRPDANVRYEAFPAPGWNGEDISGRNILVWTEQGMGDEILAASILPDAIARARQVTFLCTERVVPLARRAFPNATVAERKHPLPAAATDPNIAFQMSLGDLGGALRQSWDAFPDRPHFLEADPARVAALRRKYEKRWPGKKRIGISWRSRNHEVGWLKGADLRAWAPILSVPGDITFVSLQYGDVTEDLMRVRDALGIDVKQDKGVDPLKDMEAFAAQVACMDLVISTSNTTVHMSGALGIPTWVLLPAGRGRMWYWFRDRDDSPWYPSLRLMRQDKTGNWESLFRRCAQRLSAWLTEH